MPLVHDQLKATGRLACFRLVFVDTDAGDRVNGYERMDEETFVSASGQREFVVAISDPVLRSRIFLTAEASGAVPANVKARSAEVMDAVEIGDGAVLCSHSYIGSNVQIGRGLHLNYFAQIAHDCKIGDFVTLAPRATCNGAVIIEDNAYLGSGCLIRQTRSGEAPLIIGAGAIIGMGAVVTKSVAAGAVMIGNPARPMAPKLDF